MLLDVEDKELRLFDWILLLMFNNEDEQFETNDDEEPTMLFRLLELLQSLFPFIFNLLQGLLFTLRKSSS